jgi:hypothetical protein
MSNDYLDLYNLQILYSPAYSVERLPLESSISPICQLPPDIPLVISLPPLPSLPPLECDINVDIPLVPLPYQCVPNFISNVTVTTSGPDVDTTVTSPLSFDHVSGTDCDLALSGNIDILIPCSPQVNMTVNTAGIPITGNIDGTGSFGGSVTTTIEGCQINMAFTPTVSLNLTGDFLSYVNVDQGSLPAGGSCTSDATWLHLHSEEDGSGVTLSLEGNIPKPCFACDRNDGMYVQDLSVRDIDASSYGFENACCANPEATWRECGKLMFIGEEGGSYTNIDMTTCAAEYQINICDRNAFYLNFANTAGSTAPAGSFPIQPRETLMCAPDGSIKACLILRTDLYDPM